MMATAGAVNFNVRIQFDNQHLLDRVDRAGFKNMGHMAASVRRRAQRSMRNAPYLTRKKRGEKRTDFRQSMEPSSPGTPPRSRRGLVKKNIFYGFEPGRRDRVIIGPSRIRFRRQVVPELLEYGGKTTWNQKPGGRKITIAARPFMHPALLDTLPETKNVWRNSVRG